jgi:exopolyphosphatase/guanosine-5'-triphosphate,3'-diphosphate pyrophosphatase
MILAGIDIGTNTIRLLVTDTSDTTHRELYSGRTITRLGQELDRTGMLAPEAQERTLKVLELFSHVIGRHSVDHIAAVGTSALRNAANAAEFITAVQKRSGIEVAVITGDDEAKLTLLGVRRALSQGKRAEEDPLASALVIDIGGGSTELMTTGQGKVETMMSIPLGAVYLTERFLRNDPPLSEEMDSLRRVVSKELDAWEREAFRGRVVRPSSLATVAGTAGTITTLAAMDQALARYDPTRINGYILTRSSLDRLVNMLSVSTLDARRKMTGLEAGREDIILAGAVVAQEIMGRCGARQMLVSDWGLREGIVFDLYEKLSKTKAK